MAEISAKLVNELRGKTGLGMMECKKALNESEGDVDKAIENLRKKGVKTSITERAANEGRIGAGVSSDRKTGVIAEVNCNTDFTAKSEPLGMVIDKAVEMLLADPTIDLAADEDLKDELTAVSRQTGENVVLGRTAVLQTQAGLIGSYVYSVGGKGKIAVLVALAGSPDDDLFRQLGMHIAAARPLAATREQMPPELVEKEREIAVEQARNSGKPQPIAEKIAEGKLGAFFSERVLVDQDFINPEMYKGKVADLLKSKGATLERYLRIEVGQ